MAAKPLVVDLSHHNVVNNWREVYEWGIRGVIHKATQGSSFVDPKYSKRKLAAKSNSLLWGAYHFGTGDAVQDQVDHFLETINYQKDMLLALDYEPNPSGSQMSLNQAKKWLELVHKETGQKPVLYSGHLIKEQLYSPNTFLNGHRLWLAQYSSKAVLPPGWKKYWLWQYTGDGIGPEPHEIDGIQDSGVDINKYNGDEEQLAKEWLG